MNTESRIGQFVMQTDPTLANFYAPTYLKREIERHVPKLITLTHNPERVIREIIDLVYTRITFIDDAQIPIHVYSAAARLVREVDAYDVQFVALAKYLELKLWTGDMKLYRHLLRQGFDNVASFDEVRVELRDQ